MKVMLFVVILYILQHHIVKLWMTPIRWLCFADDFDQIIDRATGVGVMKVIPRQL